jgi:preprotein translocase subunit SecD
MTLVACSGQSGAKSSGERTQSAVHFEVLDHNASQADLKRTASIVQRRLRSLGARNATVTVGTHELIARGNGVTTASRQSLDPSALEFRPVLIVLPPPLPRTATASTSPDQTVATARDGTRLVVGPVALTGRDVQSVSAQPEPATGHWAFVVRFTKAGEAAFNQLASTLYSNPPPRNEVAVLVNGVVQTAPTIEDRTFSGDVAIDAGYSEAQAREIAAMISALPVRLRVRG